MKSKMNNILRTSFVVALFCFVLPVSFGQIQKKEKVHSSTIVNTTKIVKGIEKQGEIKGTKFPEGLAKSSTSTQRAGVNMAMRSASISSLDALVGLAVIQSVSAVSPVNLGGNSIAINKYNSTTLQIEHFSANATNKINVNVNLSDGTFSIPAGQILWTRNDGIPVYLRAIIDGYIYPDNTIDGYIDGSGNLQITTGWADIYTSEDTNYFTDGVWASSNTVHANAKMDVSFYQNSSEPLSYNVYVTQNSSLETISVLNFGNHGQEVKIIVNEDKTITIPCQLGWDIYDRESYWSDGSPRYDYYTYAADWSTGYMTDENITGTISDASINFGNWSLWDKDGGHRITGEYNDGKITLNNGTFNFAGDADEVIATTSSNAALIDVARVQGWISSSATQMTKADAEKVITLNNAFKGNESITSLTELQYFTGLTAIENDDFFMCLNLTEVIIPENVTRVGGTSFWYCENLLKVSIPASLTSLDADTFYGCYSLSEISLASGNSTFSMSDGVLYDFDKKVLVYCPAAKTQVTIPSTVTTIFNSAFQSGHLTSLTIPPSVKYLGTYCFYGNTINSVSLSSSLETIGESAFGHTKLTTITIPANVYYIGRGCFYECSSLKEILVNSANSTYTSVDGVLFSKDKSVVIRFPIAKDLQNYDIPEGTTTIANGAFQSTNLTSVTIPSSITAIEINAFYTYSENLTEITAKMVQPCEIEEYVFSSSTYQNAKLKVPSGKISVYQSTNYWSNFQNIVDETETLVTAQIDGISYALSNSDKTAAITNVGAQYDDVVVPETVTYNGQSYTVTGIAEQALASDGFNYSVSMPSTITSVDTRAFDNAETSAIIWNSNTALPTNAFSNVSDTWKNLLLYVNKTGIAPSSFANTIINGVAENIVLQEGYVFHCPKEFTAKKISFSHEFTMETLIGTSQGWETIVLPFDVATISHASKGFLIPFASYSSSSSDKPFWLYEWSSSGFVKAASMQANVPYLISMPNNAAYSTDYNLVGTITFSATNCTVKRTTNEDLRSYGFNYKYFFPSYYYRGVGGTYPDYSINSVNNLHSNDGGYAPGSIFIRNSELRYTYPFEGHLQNRSESNAPAVCEIEFAPDNSGTTDIEAIMEAIPSNSKAGGVYTLSGQKVTVDTSLPEEEIVRQLPAGVYIVNGKKVVVR